MKRTFCHRDPAPDLLKNKQTNKQRRKQWKSYRNLRNLQEESSTS